MIQRLFFAKFSEKKIWRGFQDEVITYFAQHPEETLEVPLPRPSWDRKGRLILSARCRTVGHAARPPMLAARKWVRRLPARSAPSVLLRR